MRFASALTGGEDATGAWEVAGEQIDAQLAGAAPDLICLFVSSDYASSYAQLATAVAGDFPRAAVIGCSGGGVIAAGREVEFRPGLAVVAAALPGVSVTPFHLTPGGLPSVDASPAAWAHALGIDAEPTPQFVLLPDPLTFDPGPLLAGLDAAFPRSRKIGGLSSGGRGAGEHALFLGDRVHRGGAVGAAFCGALELDTIVAQGCRPIGQPLFVSSCDEHLLLQLDGKRPLDVLRDLYESLAPEDQSLFGTSLFLGVQMREGQIEYRQGDFLIRNIVHVDRERGALLVAARPARFDVVQFHLRDARTSAEDLRLLLDRYRDERPGTAPAGSLLFSCLGRGQRLYGAPNHDSELVTARLGELPLGGFFCNGEIGQVGEQTFLHGYTSALGLFRPG